MTQDNSISTATFNHIVSQCHAAQVVVQINSLSKSRRKCSVTPANQAADIFNSISGDKKVLIQIAIDGSSAAIDGAGIIRPIARIQNYVVGQYVPSIFDADIRWVTRRSKDNSPSTRSIDEVPVDEV